jgi:hypothetical protein
MEHARSKAQGYLKAGSSDPAHPDRTSMASQGGLDPAKHPESFPAGLTERNPVPAATQDSGENERKGQKKHPAN